MFHTCSLSAFFLQLFLFVGVNADCYNMNGISALNSSIYTGGTELVSCGNGTNNCCLLGEKCGSNLLCRSTDGPLGGWLKRQYCADRYWTNCSTLAQAFKDAGYIMNNCGSNVVTMRDDNCTGTDAGPFYFVDPHDGSWTSMSTSSGSAETATYWTINTRQALASQSAASLSSVLAASTTASSMPQSIATSASATSVSTEPSQTSTPGEGSSGLSAGAGAGIGIGAAAAIAGIIVLGWLWMRQRKQKRASLAPVENANASAFTDTPVVSENAYNSSYPSNGTYKTAYEPEPQYPPQELASTGPRREM